MPRLTRMTRQFVLQQGSRITGPQMTRVLQGLVSRLPAGTSVEVTRSYRAAKAVIKFPGSDNTKTQRQHRAVANEALKALKDKYGDTDLT